jgi:FAD/FMN-containing dehydrogenase
MMFVGSEVGIEEVLSSVGGVLRARPASWATPDQFHIVEHLSPDLFWMRRTDGADTLDALVNLARVSSIDVPAEMLPSGGKDIYRLRATHNDEQLTLAPDAIIVFCFT